MELFLPDLVYDCLQCGKGCRQGWRIPVVPEVARGIEGSQSALAVTREGYLPIEDLGEVRVLGHTEQGNCVFLRDDNLCAVHAELGFAAKPRQCRQFPWQPVKTPDGFFIGVSFLCTAVQRRHGRPVTAHREDIEAAIKALLEALGDDGTLPGEVAIPVGREVTVDWHGYLRYEAFLEERLEGGGDVTEALWSAATALALEVQACSLEGTELRLERVVGAGGAPWDEVAQGLVSLLEASLVGLVEAGEPGRRREVSEAYLTGGTVYSDRLRGPIDMAMGLGGQGVAWLQSEMRRYLGHLVFRKFLVGSSVLARAAALVVLSRLLPFYTAVSASRQGRVPERDDYYSALDVVEGNLGTHAEGLSPLFAFFGEALLNHAEGLEQAY